MMKFLPTDDRSQALVPLALSFGFDLAICTMSPQVSLIKRALLLALPEATSVIVIGGRHKQVHKAEGHSGDAITVSAPLCEELRVHGGRKKTHIGLACAHYGVESLSQVLLIDDDQVHDLDIL